VPITVFGVAMAMQRHPSPIEQALKDGHEICSHGLRWINYHGIDINTEREHLQQAIEIHQQICGTRPLGWYTGRTSENTRTLLSEEGGFVYDADDYSDDLPFWSRLSDDPHLIIPYTLDCNDMRFATAQGFHTGDQFYHYLKDAFDTLYSEGEIAPKMMSVGLHCRLVGRPGRFIGLQRFLDYVLSHDNVWLARRIDIAKHWITTHPFQQHSNMDF
jgi:peptidoglycan/xylan/chitin deacetylase (PgdA/CDA1 family)